MDTTYDAILKKFRFRGRRDNLPWCSPKGTRESLAELFGELGFKEGVEIGTRKGSYARVLCEKNPGLHLTCVDPWCELSRHLTLEKQEEFFAIAQKVLKPYNVSYLRHYSMNAISYFKDESLDFVYIDGNHEFNYVVCDIIFWSKKVKKGGIIALHDYCNFYRAGVVKAVDAYTHCNRINPWFCTKEKLPTCFWVNP